ncbi:MAG: hypothetical protein JSV32_07710 [Dehalococcoidia bacterium]|nr:MAG: hypothetical protein JSV32_07710 [Dehalococcoidia bacterium]
MILVLVDCGLRLEELLKLKLNDVDKNQQLIKVNGKTGERVVRFSSTTAKVVVIFFFEWANLQWLYIQLSALVRFFDFRLLARKRTLPTIAATAVTVTLPITGG